MKKWISILCIVLLLCSAMTLAVSAAAGTAEDPVIFSGLNFNMIKVPAGATHYASFTDASGAAKRHININSTTDIEAGYAVTYGNIVETSDENGYCNLVAAADANGMILTGGYGPRPEHNLASKDEAAVEKALAAITKSIDTITTAK